MLVVSGISVKNGAKVFLSNTDANIGGYICWNKPIGLARIFNDMEQVMDFLESDYFKNNSRILWDKNDFKPHIFRDIQEDSIKVEEVTLTTVDDMVFLKKEKQLIPKKKFLDRLFNILKNKIEGDIKLTEEEKQWIRNIYRKGEE